MADGRQGAGAPASSARGSAGGAGDSGSGGRDERARAELVPLAPDERPPALLIAVGVCLLLAAAVLVGGLSIHDLASRGGSLPGAIFLAAVLVLLALGMYRRRYPAVLGFEALLAFQIIVTSLALVIASTLVAAGACLLAIGLGGWLFWKLVRVMGRIQAGEHQGGR
ncbi:MAG: hypothetical protein ABSB69_13490 [Solirubrobacteraceae bacterium]